MKTTLTNFLKGFALNFITVLPAMVVATVVETETSQFGYLLGVVVAVFLIVLVIQAMLMTVVRTHRHWLNSLIAMTVMLVAGLLFINTLSDPVLRADYTDIEFGLLLNISTELLGAAVIVILLQLRRLGVASAMVVGVIVLHLIDTAAGFTLEVYVNLASEIFGALLTGWVVYRIIERRDTDKPKRDEAAE